MVKIFIPHKYLQSPVTQILAEENSETTTTWEQRDDKTVNECDRDTQNTAFYMASCNQWINQLKKKQIYTAPCDANEPEAQ